MVAEQFRSDYLTRFSAQFGPGGFRKLMDEGAYFPDCRMAASAFSASGIATIATGAYPDAHGIVAESWYDSSSRNIIGARSSLNYASTLADQIASADNRNRVFAVAEDRNRASMLVHSAAFGALRHKLVTSETTGESLKDEPAWMAAFRKSHSPERLKNMKWQAMQADSDAPALRVLVDDPSRPEEFLALYKASPFAQENQFELFRTLVAEERLGQGPTFDFATALFTSMAQLGYESGADSPLMREMVLQMDHQLELTLDTLRKTVGQGNFGLVFTGAHGLAPLAVWSVDGAVIVNAVNEGLSEAFDLSDEKNRYVEKYVYPFLYLNHDQLRRSRIDPANARRVAGEIALRSVPGVAAYYTADGQCSRSGESRRRFQNSFHAVRSGDLMLAYEPNVVEHYGAGRGISYGSLYNYDVQVPLLFFGSQFRATVEEAPVSSVDIAPTLARALNVAAPSSNAGRVLGAAFAPDSKGGK